MTSAVVAIDKTRVLVTVAFSRFALKEKVSLKALIGLAFLFAGTICTVI